ncbi:NYN domain-containing protein [uncultured Pseudodesulfovibrio sp.]|uniref:NYN domain-containing protein n=1 Tax=uncultured Pseudodesulfovibrio sp. TaxID=2035858 RepID=UPI0029C79BEE|nr:NYN domain-containing protein [uncultured Pseudodesulfovibrio sp.]
MIGFGIDLLNNVTLLHKERGHRKGVGDRVRARNNYCKIGWQTKIIERRKEILMNIPIKAAVLIDSDNVKANFAEKVISESGEHGELVIRKAYGNWHSSKLNSWIPNLKDLGIQAVQQFDFVQGKNATDMAMTVDAMDILYSGGVDVFCLVSSDYDFAPLATRIRAAGKKVIGWGKSDSSEAYINLCSKFIFLEKKSTEKTSGKVHSADVQLNDEALILLLLSAFEEYEHEWMEWQVFVKKVHRKPFFPSNYGCKTWLKLIAQIDLFEVARRDDIQMIRLNPRSLN